MDKYSSEIEKTIKKWFEEVFDKLVDLDDEPFIDSYVRSTTSILFNYHIATIYLIRKELRLPAMALLRIMTEMVMKFIWCFYNTTNYQEVRLNFQRWAKTAGKRKIKLLNDFIESNRTLDETKSKFIKDVQKIEDILSNFDNSVKCMPQMTGDGGLFDQLSAVFGGNISASSYSQFCQAIHIDTSVLACCIERNGSTLTYTGDLDFKLDDLLNHCLSNAYMFMKTLHIFYKWEPFRIENEYLHLIPVTEK
jgi:hypothetical protein